MQIVNYILVLVVHVIVAYFLFLIASCVLLVVIATVIQHIHRRGRRIPAVEMPERVSKDIIMIAPEQTYLHRNAVS